MTNEQRTELTGEIDAARLLAVAIERLAGGDSEITFLASQICEKLTAVADELEPGDCIA